VSFVVSDHLSISSKLPVKLRMGNKSSANRHVEEEKILNLGLDDNTASALAEALSCSISKARSRVVGGALIYANQGMDDERAEKLAQFLSACGESITSVDVQKNEIGTIGGKAIAEALMKNSAIIELSIRVNRVGECAALMIGKTFLRHLNLGGNLLGDDAVESLSKGLASNITLEELVLVSNRIGPKGGIALSAAMAQNNTLRLLYLGNNDLGDQGILLLAAALEKNTSLKTLQIKNNNFGPEGAAGFAHYLHRNTSLTVLRCQLQRHLGRRRMSFVIQCNQSENRRETLPHN
jgi:Ran GTPase-activating protein (RanGAP) involved in mRNA processing and transport